MVTSTAPQHQLRPVVHPAPLGKVAVEGRRVRGPDHQARVSLPVSLGHLAQREFAMISLREHAKEAAIAHSFTRKGLCPQRVTSPKRRSMQHVSSKEGNCSRGDKCRFQHKDIEKPSTPAPKLPQQHPRVEHLGPIPPHLVAEEEAPGRSPRTRQASLLHALSPLSM